MTLSNRARREWRIIIGLSIGSALLSVLFTYIVSHDSPIHVALVGITNSLLIATPILLFEVKGPRRWPFRRMRRLPLLVYFGLRVLFYVVVIVGGLVIARLLFHGSEPLFNDTFPISVAFALAMSVVVNLTFEIGLLLGFGTLRNLLAGRYVQPKREHMAFLLIDMKDSTGLAERLGPIRFHELLNSFFGHVSEAALECGAEVHKYVGDEAILTWPAAAVGKGECLACPFVTRDFIAADGARYRRRFGAIPEFRAALHCGEIVAGEIGEVRHEIAYVGDTLNVAARLLEASKAIGRDILASTDLLQQARLPPDLKAERLPTLMVRGRAAPLEISALQRLGA